MVLAFAWSAYPYTDFVLQSNTNDSLVAALVVGALLVISSPPARGALAALGGLVKFASFALVPLLAAGPRAGLASRDPETGDGPLSAARLRALALFALALVGVSALLMLQATLDPGLSTFYDRTIASQINRDSPFSVWGQTPSAEWLQHVVQVAAAVLAILVAFVPRRRSLPQIAALAAAVLILGVHRDSLSVGARRAVFGLITRRSCALAAVACAAPDCRNVLVQRVVQLPTPSGFFPGPMCLLVYTVSHRQAGRSSRYRRRR